MAAGDALATDTGVARVTDSGNHQQAAFRAATTMSHEGNSIARAHTLPVMMASAGDVQIVNSQAAPVRAVEPAGPALDRSKSVSELMTEGVIKPADASIPVPAAVAPDASIANAPAQVTVTYNDASQNDPAKAPDIIVRQDGTIEATNDFQAAGKKNLVVQVEHQPGDTSDPNPLQRAALDNVVSYLYDRMSADPSIGQNGLKVNDEFGLISDALLKQLATNGNPGKPDAASEADARRDFSPESQRAMSNMSRMGPGQSGQMSRDDIERNFPQRDVPTLEGETDKIQDSKNAVAAMFNPEKSAPYETLRSHGDQGYAAGRYGLTYPLMNSWFSGMGMNLDDTDEEGFITKLEQLDKEGKLPPVLKKIFVGKNGKLDHNKIRQFHKFAHDMHSGKGLTSADVKANLPKELQEQMAMDLVKKFNAAGGDSVGKTALGFHLGKSPDQLTPEDLAAKGNQEYMQSAEKLAKLSGFRHGMGEGDKLDWKVNPNGTELDGSIIKAAFHKAASMGTTGRCAEGFQIGVSRFAPELMGTGDGVAMRRSLAHSQNFQQVSWNDAQEALRAGKAVAVSRQWASGGLNNGGHVALLAYNNGRIMEASDHVTTFRKENNYYNTRNDAFFVYTGGKRNTASA